MKQNDILTIFDLDDTLIQTTKATALHEKEFFAAHGLFYTRRERQARLIGQPYDIFIRNLRDDFRCANGRDMPDGFAADLRQMYRDALARGIEMTPGVADVLQWMRREGRARCIASNSNSVFLPWKLEISGLDAHFNFHADAEGLRNAFSKDEVAAGCGKPAPDLPLYAALQMGGYPTDRCIMVEDSVPGVRAGRAAGMFVIGFAGDAECGEEGIEMLLSSGADVVACDMEDVRRAIAQRYDFLCH
ncbi:MAG: HAD family phosphatase [Proteobacteria bacterium]|nr:HAD family phosphatase [Pseudomonadota bacterium]